LITMLYKTGKTAPAENNLITVSVVGHDETDNVAFEKTNIDYSLKSKKLAIVQMVVSCSILVLGVIAACLGTHFLIFYFITASSGGSHIWASIIGIVSSGLGLGALRYGKYGRPCLLIAHFVMCIMSCIGFTIIIVAAIQLFLSPALFVFWDENDNVLEYSEAIRISAIILQSLILIGAMINFIASIIAPAFICRYWCGKSDGEPTTIYILSQIGGGNGPLQAITVPPGSQVIFLSTLPTHGQTEKVPLEETA